MGNDHWAVEVWRNGESVVRIESNCLGGREISPEDEEAIDRAARNLLGFIGRGEPAESRLRTENEALRDALKPFAAFADIIAKERPGWDHDRFTLINWRGDQAELPDLMLAPFRRAAALSKGSST